MWAHHQDEQTPLLANRASAASGRPRTRLNRAREASAPLRFSPAFAPARAHHPDAALAASEHQHPLINTSRYPRVTGDDFDVFAVPWRCALRTQCSLLLEEICCGVDGIDGWRVAKKGVAV